MLVRRLQGNQRLSVKLQEGLFARSRDKHAQVKMAANNSSETEVRVL